MTNRWGDRVLGWLLSAGIHVVLLLGTALVFIDQLVAYDVDITGYSFGVADPTPKLDPVVHRDVFDRKGVAPEDGDPFKPDETEPTFFPGSAELEAPESKDIVGSKDIFAHDSERRGQTVPSALAVFSERAQRAAAGRYNFLQSPSRGGCPIRKLY